MTWDTLRMLDGLASSAASTPPHPGAGDAEKSIGNRLSVIEIKAFRSVHPELSLAKAMEELSKSKAELQQRSS